MPTTNSLLEYRSQLESLLWSLWTELGVPGWERMHRDWWIDPEALLLFTATVASVDPRLREEAISWCGRYRRFLSEIRVKSQLAEPRFGDPSRYQPQLGLFLGSVPIARSCGLAKSPRPNRQQLSLRSDPMNLNRAALLSLQLRSLLGVTAKAEVVRVFLAGSNSALSASDLVKEGVGYTKRAVRDALEDLRLGGFVESAVADNRKEYRLFDRGSMSNLLNAKPVCFPRWRQLFAVLRGILDLFETLEDFRPATKPIEIRRALTNLDSEIRDAGLQTPVLDAGCEVVEAFEAWACAFIGELASGSTDWMPGER